jgi:hypothetical protein
MQPDIDAAPVNFALYLAGHGLPVIPLPPRSKGPTLKDWPALATVNPRQIEAWFDQTPDGNYGIATAGLVAVDIDPRHGGHLWLEDHEHRLPETFRFRTGGGGLHLLYKAPEGRAIGNRANLAPGVDIRGNGGQIVGPGSIHPDGEQYTIEIGPDDVDLAEAPTWLIELIEQPAANGQDGPDIDLNAGPIPERARNHTLTRICGHLFKVHSEEKVRAELHRINLERCQPRLSPPEVDGIVSSIAGREAKQQDKAAAPPGQEPLGDPFGKLAAPPLPLGLLPSTIEAYAEHEARAKGVVFHAPAMAALTVCAAAIPDHVQIKVKVHEPWRECARLWVALIGPPSAKKSPTVRSTMAPLKRLEKEEYARWCQLKAEWDKANKESRGDAPVPRRYILNDATIEAAGKKLAENPHGLLLERDELAGWFGAMDKYSSGKGAAADRAFWLTAWNGGPYAVDRVSRASTYISNLSVSILGAIQPDTIRRIVGDTVDDGLLQRLIPITVGSAGVGEDSPDHGHSFREYDGLIARLADLKPTVIKFDGAAQEVRRAFERHTHELSNLEILSPQLAAFCGKLDGLFARLALIFHFCKSQPPAEHVSEETALRVDRLMKEFIIPHAMRFYLEIAGETGTMASARNIAGYVLSKNVERLTFGILTRDCWPCRGRSRDEVIRMLEPLEMFGWLTPDDPILPRAWTVRPEVHQQFADHAAQERQRREAVRTTLHRSTGAKEP